jgi:hypothetical protein
MMRVGDLSAGVEGVKYCIYSRKVASLATHRAGGEGTRYGKEANVTLKLEEGVKYSI